FRVMRRSAHRIQRGPHEMQSGAHRMRSGLHAMRNVLYAMPSGPHEMQSGAHAMRSGLHAMPRSLHAIQSGVHAMRRGLHVMPGGSHAVLPLLNPPRTHLSHRQKMLFIAERTRPPPRAVPQPTQLLFSHTSKDYSGRGLSEHGGGRVRAAIDKKKRAGSFQKS